MKLVPKFDASTIDIDSLPSIPFAERKANLPNSSGIYFVLDASRTVLYVGRARKMLTRWRGNHAGHRFAEASIIAWVAVDDHYMLPQMEDACIEHFRPTLNKNPRPSRVPREPLPRPSLPQWIWDLMPHLDHMFGRSPNRKGVRKLGLTEALRECQAITLTNPEAGRKLQAYIDWMFSEWLEEISPEPKTDADLVRASAELYAARLESKPSHVQREQALALRATVDQFISGLDNTFELRSQASNVKEMRR